jgi:hypothetical protein
MVVVSIANSSVTVPMVLILLLQTLHDYGHWKREGRLLPFNPHKWEYVYSSLRTPKALSLEPPSVNNTVPTAQVVIEHVINEPCNKNRQFGSFVYNNESLKASDLPSTYDELLDPSRKTNSSSPSLTTTTR